MTEVDEIELIAHGSDDGQEFTLVLKCTRRMTADEIMIEIESYVHELNRAETQRRVAVIQ